MDAKIILNIFYLNYEQKYFKYGMNINNHLILYIIILYKIIKTQCKM